MALKREFYKTRARILYLLFCVFFEVVLCECGKKDLKIKVKSHFIYLDPFLTAEIFRRLRRVSKIFGYTLRYCIYITRNLKKIF